MRQLYFPLLLLFALAFTACLTEEENSILTVENEVSEPEVPTLNFTTSLGDVQINYGYLYAPEPEAEGSQNLLLVLTREEVSEGDLLTGRSLAITVELTSPDGELSGSYRSDAGEGGRKAGMVSYYRSVDFQEPEDWVDRTHTIGRVAISSSPDGYRVEVVYGGGTAALSGTFNGALTPVRSAYSREIPAEAEFQGPTGFMIANNTAAEFRHAYLYPRGTSGTYYDLALTEHELETTEGLELSGTSNALMFRLDTKDLQSGTYRHSGNSGGDFLSGQQQGLINRFGPYFCTNYNFDTGTFDDDEPTDGESIVRWDGEEFMIRFRGTLYGTEVATEGLYRGPLTIVE